MKLSEAMKEKMLLSFEVYPPKTEKGMENLPGTIEHLMNTNRSTFHVHMVQAAETLVQTVKYVR